MGLVLIGRGASLGDGVADGGRSASLFRLRLSRSYDVVIWLCVDDVLLLGDVLNWDSVLCLKTLSWIPAVP